MTNITRDPLYHEFIKGKTNLSESSQTKYKHTIQKFCKINQQNISEIIQKAKNQQDKVIEKTTYRGTDEEGNEIVEKTITKFDVNSQESIIKQCFDNYLTTCKKNKNKNITINNEIRLIRSFLNYFDVTLPKWEQLEKEPKKWYLLEKEDFKYVMNDSSLTHASLIKFLQSTGMRLRDALSLEIGDFMMATSDYHDFNDVTEFIDKAPADMIGSWYFHPSKTQRYNVACQTFNDPETSNLILQNLRRIKNEYLPYKNRKDNIELKISKKDALFGSQTQNFKGKIPPKAISDRFWKKNKKLREWRISKIKEKINTGEISEEDYEKEISKIPKFHAHACRKYFESMIAKNCGNLRICTLIEGHVSPVKTDSFYIKQDLDEVKEAYLAAIDDLSLENTETKVYTSEIRKEMESKIRELEDKNKQMEDELSEINDIKMRLLKLEQEN